MFIIERLIWFRYSEEINGLGCWWQWLIYGILAINVMAVMRNGRERNSGCWLLCIENGGLSICWLRLEVLCGGIYLLDKVGGAIWWDTMETNKSFLCFYSFYSLQNIFLSITSFFNAQLKIYTWISKAF